MAPLCVLPSINFITHDHNKDVLILIGINATCLKLSRNVTKLIIDEKYYNSDIKPLIPEELIAKHQVADTPQTSHARPTRTE